MTRKLWLVIALFCALPPSAGYAQPLPKARVAELIKRVEDGVDRFRDYLERRGDDARDRAKDKNGGARRGNEANKDRAEGAKDDLDNAMGDLNRSTNRLRRKFDATDTWMETKGEVNTVVDDGRKVNQIIERGKSGGEADRLWGALRTEINELARAYGVAPLAR